MSKIEIITSRESFNYEDFLQAISSEATTTSKVRDFERRNHNPLIVFLAGSLLWSIPCDASVLKTNISAPTEFQTPSFESFLDFYSNEIDVPFANYFEELTKKIPQIKYCKKDLVKEIISFKSLKQNWDGFEALPLEVESAANAIALIDLLGDEINSHLDQIYPNPQGTISLIWNNDSNETVFVEVGNNTMSFYVQLAGKAPQFFNNIVLNDFEAAKISEFIKILF